MCVKNVNDFEILVNENIFSHERAWLRSDIFSVQVQAVLEVENEESAKEIEKIIAEKYENVEVSKGGIHSFS